MPKRDFYNDPNAPTPNSIVVAVTAVVRNDQGQVLLIQRTDNGLWAAPGGAQDFGERVADAAVREVREETGLEVDVTGISGVYSDPGHVIAYDDGEVRQEFSICFHARPVGGTLQTSSESKRVEWVEPDQIEKLSIHPSMQLRLRNAVERPDKTYVG